MASTPRNDKDVVPEVAKRHGPETDHYIGRGGAGNAVREDGISADDREKEQDGEKESEHALGEERERQKGLADKLKDMMRGKK